ncbi:MAG: hypothetical protein H7126_08870 [Candidatus Parcubacteria bacterium]|nr:hypothetical protein [Leptolyngbyaceae cyanobacterium LF-bin-113]
MQTRRRRLGGCSEAPAGRVRWTLRLFAERMVKLGHVKQISHKTIRKTLKKSNSSLECLDRRIPDQHLKQEVAAWQQSRNARNHTVGFQETPIDEIVVSLESSSEGQTTLTVSNSGSNLPADFDLSRLDSLGLQLVQSLVHQIEGTLEAERSDRTTFRLTFDNPISELGS